MDGPGGERRYGAGTPYGAHVPPPDAVYEAPQRRPRRWPWITVSVLALLGAGIAAGVALDQRATAAQWEDRAAAFEAQRDDAAERSAELSGQVDEALDALETSERDVDELEDRVRELAEEKARAEDDVTTVQVQRDTFVELSEQVADATESLDTCVELLFDLHGASVEAFNAASSGDPVDVDPLNAQAERVTDLCSQAREDARAASTAADRLVGP